MKFNPLIPELSVKNFEKSLQFYTGLGFKIEYERKGSKFAFLSYEGSQIMIEQINNHWKTGDLEYPFGRGINFQIETSNAEKLLNVLKNNKYTLFKKLKENWYRKNNKLVGNKEFLIQDPNGYLLRFAEDLGEKNCRNSKK